MTIVRKNFHRSVASVSCILCFGLSLHSSPAMAEVAPRERGLLVEKEPSASELMESGEPLQRWGRALTITGLIFLPLGGVMLGLGKYFRDTTPGDHPDADKLFAGGITCTAISIPALLIGAPMWAVGAARVRRAEQMQLSIVPQLQLRPQGSSTAGLALSLRF